MSYQIMKPKVGIKTRNHWQTINLSLDKPSNGDILNIFAFNGSLLPSQIFDNIQEMAKVMV